MNILLIAFKYPPYSRVGSYRWTKFSRLLADRGVKFDVVTVDWRITDKNSWINDVTHPNITIHRIKSHSCHNIKYRTYDGTIAGRIKNKLRNQFDKILRLAYFVDEAQFWGRSLVPYCLRLAAAKRFDAIVTTGAPFMENYWASVLYNKLGRAVPLVQDLRDEWNEGRKFRFARQKKLSLEYEKFALNNCSAVVSASPGLKNLFDRVITDGVRSEVIYNGFDTGTVRSALGNGRVTPTRFSLIYGGSLENGRDVPVRRFLDVVLENIADYPGITIDFYTDSILKDMQKYKTLVDGGYLAIHRAVPQKTLYERINNSFAALHFMPAGQEYIVSIKLFEYAVFGRPTLSVNSGGDSEILINRHKLGYSADFRESSAVKGALSELYRIWQDNPGYAINPVDIEQFSYDCQTDRYLSLLKGL